MSEICQTTKDSIYVCIKCSHMIMAKPGLKIICVECKVKGPHRQMKEAIKYNN